MILTANTGAGTITKGTALKFDKIKCTFPSLVKIDSTHFLCVYEGNGGNGQAVILTVNTGSNTVTTSSPAEFEVTKCSHPALAKIDAANYFCAFGGKDDDGYAKILRVNVGSGTISTIASYEFDNKNCLDAAIATIGNNRFICAYQGTTGNGIAKILKVNSTAWTVSTEAEIEFDPTRGGYPDLASIDNKWFLCVYEGSPNRGLSVMINTDLHILP